MAEETDDTKFSMDEAAIEQLLIAAHLVKKGKSLIATINGKKWRVRPTSSMQELIKSNIDIDVMYWKRQLKEAVTVKTAKKLNTKIRCAYARKAAHSILGKRLRWVPFLYYIMYRRLLHCSEEVSATINATDAIGENKVFYLANLGSSKQALTLSMKQVGEGVEQRTQRGESAESMAKKDGLPKKEDNKSPQSSNGRRTTIK